MVLKTRVSLETFLAEPERDEAPYLELMDGEVYEKPVGGRIHSRIVSFLMLELGIYLRRTREAWADTELRHSVPGREWVFLPDVSATRQERQSAPPAGSSNAAVEILPDLAIEVLSPDDRFSRITRKVAHYMESGVRLLWVIDPEAETVTVFRPGEPAAVFSAPEKLSATPVLESFELDFEALFASLHD